MKVLLIIVIAATEIAGFRRILPANQGAIRVDHAAAVGSKILAAIVDLDEPVAVVNMHAYTLVAKKYINGGIKCGGARAEKKVLRIQQFGLSGKTKRRRNEVFYFIVRIMLGNDRNILF